MRRLKTLSALFVAMLLMGAVSSCEKQNEPVVDNSVSIEIANPNIAVLGGSTTLQINTTADWTISVGEGGEWLTLSATSGTGSSEVTLSAEANPSFTENRIAELTIATTADNLQSVVITQIGELPDANIEFTDPLFKTLLLMESTDDSGIARAFMKEPNIPTSHIPAKIDANGDGEISYQEAAAVQQIFTYGFEVDKPERLLSSIEELKYFTNIELLFIHRSEIAEVDLSNLPELTECVILESQLNEIDLSSNVNIVNLCLSDSYLTALDLTNLTKLEVLELYRNRLTELTLNQNAPLSYVDLYGNRFTQFDISTYGNLTLFYLSSQTSDGQTEIIPTVTLTSDQFYSEVLSLDDCDVYPDIIGEEPISTGNIESLDPIFKDYLINKGIDYNGDGEISYLEALNTDNIWLNYTDVDNLDYIKHFRLLSYITMEASQITGEIDLSHNNALTDIYLRGNQITSVILPTNTDKLGTLSIHSNHIADIDVSMYSNLGENACFFGSQTNSADGSAQVINVTMTEAQRDLPIFDAASDINLGVVVVIAE